MRRCLEIRRKMVPSSLVGWLVVGLGVYRHRTGLNLIIHAQSGQV